MRKLILSMIGLALAFATTSNAQVTITSVGTPYTQNFDSLSNDTTFATPHAMGLNGWAIFEKGSSGAVDQQYKVSNGSRNNGETYSYGDSSLTDRALGSLASGTNLPSFGVVFKNSTGANITDLTITYKGEQWRSGDTSAASLDSLILEYSTSATGINDTAASWNPVYSLMLNSINLATVVVGSLNGNIAPNTNTKTGTISVLIPDGAKLSLRWRDINKSGSDDGLAIDDLTINFSASGNPKPSITSTTPIDNSTLISPSLTSLTMTFDQTVMVGTGNITVKNLTDGTNQTIACALTTIAGTMVTIPGVTLVSGKQYAVNFDSTCYTSSTLANSYGIYDNISWDFETQPNGLIDYTANNLDLSMIGNNILSFNLTNSASLTMAVYDMNGKINRQQTIKGLQGENRISLENSSLATGMYLLKVSNKEFKGSLKFKKQ